MSKAIFIDTSGWVALYHRQDNLYKKATKIYKELLANPYCYHITTNFILDETFTLLMLKAGHSIAVDLGEKLRNSETVKVIRINEDIENRSWELFKQYSDKEFSFTDCTSFIILEDFKNRKKDLEILGSDKHFKQMGYEILLSK